MVDDNTADQNQEILKETEKTLKGLQASLVVKDTKQVALFKGITNSISKQLEISTKAGFELSNTGQLFQDKLDNIVSSAGNASIAELKDSRKEVKKLLSSIKTATSGPEKKLLIAQFETLKGGLEQESSLRKSLVEGINTQVQKGAAQVSSFLSSVVQDSPVVGIVASFAIDNAKKIALGIIERKKEKKERQVELLKAQVEDQKIAIDGRKKITSETEAVLEEIKKAVITVVAPLKKVSPLKGRVSPRKGRKFPKTAKITSDNLKTDNLSVQATNVSIGGKKNEVVAELKKSSKKSDIKKNADLITSLKTNKIAQRGLKIQQRQLAISRGILKESKNISALTKAVKFFGKFFLLDKVITFIKNNPIKSIIAGVVAGTAVAGVAAFVFKDEVAEFFKSLKEKFFELVESVKRFFGFGSPKTEKEKAKENLEKQKGSLIGQIQDRVDGVKDRRAIPPTTLVDRGGITTPKPVARFRKRFKFVPNAKEDIPKLTKVTAPILTNPVAEISERPLGMTEFSQLLDNLGITGFEREDALKNNQANIDAFDKKAISKAFKIPEQNKKQKLLGDAVINSNQQLQNNIESSKNKTNAPPMVIAPSTNTNINNSYNNIRINPRNSADISDSLKQR